MYKRKGASCEPCGCDSWKMKIKELWENYQEVVRSIRAGDTSYYPDGDGQVSLPGILSDVQLTDMFNFWIMSIDTQVSSLTLTDNTTYYTLEVDNDA